MRDLLRLPVVFKFEVHVVVGVVAFSAHVAELENQRIFVAIDTMLPRIDRLLDAQVFRVLLVQAARAVTAFAGDAFQVRRGITGRPTAIESESRYMALNAFAIELT